MNPPIYCVIHCRVSTGKQAYEGESLDAQERICRDIISRNGWHLAHDPWLEAYSGRKQTRQTFAEVLAYLDKHPGRVRFYVFRAIDRFTRGGVLLYSRMKQELAQRGVELVDSMGVIQPSRNTLEHVGFEYDWSRISPSEIAEVVMATTARTEVNTILTRLIGQEIALTRQGYKIRGPQDGYNNEKVYINGKKRTVLAADPDRAKFIIAMFELRAAGQLSDAEIVARVNAMGYRRRSFNRWNASHTEIIGRSGGGPLLTKRLQEIIRRPIYCGVVWEKWTDWKPVKAPYPGLVSVDIWNAANRGARHVSEGPDGLELKHNFDPSQVGKMLNRDHPDYRFKNVVVCPTCRKPFMASASRGRSGQFFPAYHCDRTHPRISRSKEAFETSMRAYIGGLQFVPRASELVAQAIFDRFADRQRENDAAAVAMQRTIADLEAEKAQAVQAFKAATGDALRIALEADVARLDAEIAKALAVRRDVELTDGELRGYITDLAEILEHPLILLESPADMRVQRSRYARTFVDPPTISEIEAGTAKLSAIFEAVEGQADPQSVLVRLRGLTWNHIHAEILRVREVESNTLPLPPL